MNRHGIVIPREDGVRARCMGPGPCPECNKDIMDAPREQLLDGLTKHVADAWSKNEPLLKLVTSVFVCGQISVSSAEPGPEIVGVPISDGPDELKCLGALMYLCDRFETQLNAQQMARVSYYLADKYTMREPIQE